MIIEPVSAFLPAEYRIKFATRPWEFDAARRSAGRCSASSRASSKATTTTATRSTSAMPIVAVSSIAVTPHEVVGTVRIHEAEPGVWWARGWRWPSLTARSACSARR